ncbi:hypothetical protein SAMN05421827_109145 [Pedobacter terrae]|uniref:Uncharacterized protein n=1 Tax=Pedobacter terrae TaxID=405671 RepID=A0A1G7W8E4_9SPHI|nr:hypothetical protein [Pedobacter terrae]SDG68226.1 hypothetical protein SAMN05421827_109145 [Pedobacter terrae]
MIPISGNYIKDEKEVPFSAEIPSAWEELEAHQYATIVEIRSFSKADPYTMAMSLLTVLMGVDNYHILYYLPDEDKHSLVSLTNFIMDVQVPVKNFFPTLQLRKKKHFAPSEFLSELNFGEWCFAYQAWNYYTQFKDDKFLDELIAILYRQKSTDEHALDKVGDIREPFNENLISKNAKSVGNVHHRIKLAIYAWFTASINLQMSYRPTAFPVGTGENVDSESDQVPATIFSLFRELLGPKWGTTGVLRLENADFVLDGLEEMRIAFKESQKSITA